MIFDKPVATWTQEDLQFLVDRGIEESRLLEYKQERSSPKCAVIALLDNLTPFQIQTLVAQKSSDTLSGLFILEQYQQDLKISDSFFDYCLGRIGKSTRYLQSDGLGDSVYNRKWRLVVPTNLFHMYEQEGDEFA